VIDTIVDLMRDSGTHHDGRSRRGENQRRQHNEKRGASS
jgi:hypothetical protein